VFNLKEFAVLGLEPRDISVYEALYKHGRASLRSLAQTTGLNRGTVYEVVKKLLDVGMVTFTQVGERRHYTAVEPEVILSLIRERHDQLQQLEIAARSYANQLRTNKVLTGSGYLARFFEGDEGVAAILRDVLQTVKKLDSKSYEVISSQHVSSFIYNNFRSFSRQRIKLGLFVRVISDVASSEKLILAKRRQLPSGSGEFKKALDAYIIFYGNKMALISLNELNQLSGIVVTDTGITDTQRVIFERLWQELKPQA
jgi:sugar-specific transcriptional regulator TrmB